MPILRAPPAGEQHLGGGGCLAAPHGRGTRLQLVRAGARGDPAWGHVKTSAFPPATEQPLSKSCMYEIKAKRNLF